MNPLDEVCLPIHARTAIERFQEFATKQEEAEQKQADAAEYERLARAEGISLQREARHRIERYMTGETSEERQQREYQAEELRQARIQELERELQRLDPARARVQRAQEQQIQADALLARSRRVAEQGWALISRIQSQRGQPVLRRDDPRSPDCEECAEVGATRSESAAIHADREITRGIGYVTGTY